MRRPLLALALLSLTACTTVSPFATNNRFGCVITNRDKAAEIGHKAKAAAARPAAASPAQAAVVIGINAAAIAAGRPVTETEVLLPRPEVRPDEPHAKP
jgi:hypothetical protein